MSTDTLQAAWLINAAILLEAISIS